MERALIDIWEAPFTAVTAVTSRASCPVSALATERSLRKTPTNGNVNQSKLGRARSEREHLKGQQDQPIPAETTKTAASLHFQASLSSSSSSSESGKFATGTKPVPGRNPIGSLRPLQVSEFDQQTWPAGREARPFLWVFDSLSASSLPSSSHGCLPIQSSLQFKSPDHKSILGCSMPPLLKV